MDYLSSDCLIIAGFLFLPYIYSVLAMLNDETTLDILGTISFLVGVCIVAYVAVTSGAVVSAAEAATPLILAGLAAIVGGGAVKMFLKNR